MTDKMEMTTEWNSMTNDQKIIWRARILGGLTKLAWTEEAREITGINKAIAGHPLRERILDSGGLTPVDGDAFTTSGGLCSGNSLCHGELRGPVDWKGQTLVNTRTGESFIVTDCADAKGPVLEIKRPWWKRLFKRKKIKFPKQTSYKESHSYNKKVKK